MPEIKIEIPNIDDREKLNAITKIEDALGELGITFDTGFDFQENRRDWFFDFSLRGARVKRQGEEGCLKQQ